MTVVANMRDSLLMVNGRAMGFITLAMGESGKGHGRPTSRMGRGV
jgi:hypothetical protein